MDLYCTRPGCPKPTNPYPDLDNSTTLKTVEQKYCTTCGMPLILIGRYLTLQLLGQGGFGAAFLARDRYTPGMRQCVVKLFQPSGTLTPAQLQVAQELFEREAETLEHLGNRHTEIPDLYAFFELTVHSLQPGTQEQFFYLVQEFIDGQTMEELLAQQGQLPLGEVLEMLQAVLHVLQFVHDHHSIHRDIKPSNIMRHRDGRFYLLDFGAVKQAAKGVSGRSTGIYSVGFAPPEQVAGSEVYPSTDLYALAVTCIMLLTGKEPNELFDSYSNTWRWHPHVPHVGRPVSDVLDRMLLPTPSQRFQSAIEVLEALNSGRAASTQKPSQPARKPPYPTVATSSSSVAQPKPVQQPPHLPTQPPVAQPQSAPLQASPQAQSPVAPRPRPTIARFSTLELLGGAAFTGFEAGLLAIALTSLLGTSLIGGGFWLLLVLGLIAAQSRRIIERIDLVIIMGITLTVVLFVPALRRIIPATGNTLLTVVIVAAIAAALAIAITTLFRLIYNMLSKFL